MVSDNLGERQVGFKEQLLGNVKSFKDNIKSYRDSFIKNGPGVQGISPEVAIDRTER